MKIVFWAVLCVLFGTAVFSAPVAEDDHQEAGSLETDISQSDYQRDRRLDSDYYAVAPCGTAGSSNMPVASYSLDSLYQSNVGPLQARYYASEYGHPDYAANWYRSIDPYRDNREMMRYSDANFAEQTPQMNNMFRSVHSSYMPVNTPNMANFNGQMPHPVGAAYGVFPNANVGDCNVPLLLSCSPSIVTGRIVNPDSSGFDSLSLTSGRPSYYGYRGVNGQYLHGTVPSSHAEHTTNDHDSPSSLVNSVQNNKVL